ncbi:MAG: hypothetical protein JWR46_3940 [Mycobacterium sp.]|nr:hypothetical protein [Mycobacterium sp.]
MIDVETTGLYNVDRIVEVAILTLDCEGNVCDEFETMVQPLRDVGATWIHGLDAGMLRDAPTFAEVAQHVEHGSTAPWSPATMSASTCG